MRYKGAQRHSHSQPPQPLPALLIVLKRPTKQYGMMQTSKRVEVVEMSKTPGQPVWENPNAETEFQAALAKAKQEKEYAERAATNWRNAPSSDTGTQSARTSDPSYQMHHNDVIDIDALDKET